MANTAPCNAVSLVDSQLCEYIVVRAGGPSKTSFQMGPGGQQSRNAASNSNSHSISGTALSILAAGEGSDQEIRASKSSSGSYSPSWKL